MAPFSLRGYRPCRDFGAVFKPVLSVRLTYFNGVFAAPRAVNFPQFVGITRLPIFNAGVMDVFIVFPPCAQGFFIRFWISLPPSRRLSPNALYARARAGVPIATVPVFARFSRAIKVQLKLYGFCAFQAKNFNL